MKIIIILANYQEISKNNVLLMCLCKENLFENENDNFEKFVLHIAYDKVFSQI